MLDLEARIHRISGSRQWSRAGAHLVVVALVALSAAGGVIGARAQELSAGAEPRAESAAFPFNLVAIAQAAEDSSALPAALILNLDPGSYQEPVSRQGSPESRFVGETELTDPTAEELIAAAAEASTDGGGPDPEVATPEAEAAAAAAAPVPMPEVPGAVQAPTGVLGWPVAGGSISQGYWPGHLGIDIAAPWGTAVVASGGGTVTYAGWRDNGGGYVVEIVHDNGLITVYNHLSSIWVWPGQYVTWGQGIGAVGCSGLCYGPHLHFAVFSAYAPVNPLYYL